MVSYNYNRVRRTENGDTGSSYLKQKRNQSLGWDMSWTIAFLRQAQFTKYVKSGSFPDGDSRFLRGTIHGSGMKEISYTRKEHITYMVVGRVANEKQEWYNRCVVGDAVS